MAVVISNVKCSVEVRTRGKEGEGSKYRFLLTEGRKV